MGIKDAFRSVVAVFSPGTAMRADIADDMVIADNMLRFAEERELSDEQVDRLEQLIDRDYSKLTAMDANAQTKAFEKLMQEMQGPAVKPVSNGPGTRI